ncbi:MAG: hypothetical protein GY849_15315 [Deltaproteobacteria bacterium]|nr:hypothetical protein [Deltaproteobacteria bacterium]
MNMEAGDGETERLFRVFKKQVAMVMEAFEREPSREKQILSVFVSRFFEAIKETVRSQGYVMPLYIILSDPIDYGMPPLTEEVIQRAAERKCVAIVSVEGFQSENDIGDVIYHVSMSSPSLGVLGWVLQVRVGDGKVTFEREMPYHFDAREKVKTLGELIYQMERE